MFKKRRLPWWGLPLAGVAIGLLVVPEATPPLHKAAPGAPFRWDRDGLFLELGQRFAAARSTPPEEARAAWQALAGEGRALLSQVLRPTPEVPSGQVEALEAVQFRLGAHAAARRELLAELAALLREFRLGTLEAARAWDLRHAPAQGAVYRLLYGGRAALEEALVQHGTEALPPLTLYGEVSSPAPSTVVEGVRVHSGDVVLSRGGAPTSALIARGSDFPGNFSHAALVHVDPGTGEASVIEALIERGVVVSPLGAYLADPKLRILLLRIRPDHPTLANHPLLAHEAASAMLARARGRHIPYDFSMDWQDGGSFFCSEVPYHAYLGEGIDLWPRRSTMSAPGLVAWLGSLGVRHFTTLVPSDLEYAPALVPVAEWRNPSGLRQDRLDNATLDALLEAAEEGARLGYPWWELPLARAAKAWSWGAGLWGGEVAIPAGMKASTALRVRALVQRVHPRLRARLEGAAEGFREESGYEPPYWELQRLAREQLGALRSELLPALTR